MISNQKIWIISILIILIISGCGNERERTEVKGQAIGSTRDTTVRDDLEKAIQLPTFFILSMSAGEFLQLATRRGDMSRRLVFQFCYSANHPGLITLRGWPGKENGRFVTDTSRYILTPHSIDSDNFGNEFYLGQQKLQKNAVDVIIGSINNDTTKFVIFNPEIDATTKQITYSIDVVSQVVFEKGLTIDKLATLAITNPSPPASSRDNRID